MTWTDIHALAARRGLEVRTSDTGSEVHVDIERQGGPTRYARLIVLRGRLAERGPDDDALIDRLCIALAEAALRSIGATLRYAVWNPDDEDGDAARHVCALDPREAAEIIAKRDGIGITRPTTYRVRDASGRTWDVGVACHLEPVYRARNRSRDRSMDESESQERSGEAVVTEEGR